MPKRTKGSPAGLGGLESPSERIRENQFTGVADNGTPSNDNEPTGRVQGGGGEPGEGDGTIDPAGFPDPGIAGNQPRRRGRKPGSRNSAKVPADITNLAGLIAGGHLFIASLLSVPELEIDESEAQKLSDAAQKLLSLYVVQIDPKKLAWAEFAAALGSVYGPRAVAIYRKGKSKRSEVIPIRKPEPVPESSPAFQGVGEGLPLPDDLSGGYEA